MEAGGSGGDHPLVNGDNDGYQSDSTLATYTQEEREADDNAEALRDPVLLDFPTESPRQHDGFFERETLEQALNVARNDRAVGSILPTTKTFRWPSGPSAVGYRQLDAKPSPGRLRSVSHPNGSRPKSSVSAAATAYDRNDSRRS